MAMIDLVKSDAEAAAADLVSSFGMPYVPSNTEFGIVTDRQAEEGEISAVGLGCDVASENAVKVAMKEVVDKFGQIDVLVTSAGAVPIMPI